jgi:hypothetical protein
MLGRVEPADTRQRRVSDLISYQNDVKERAPIVGKVERA